jgi:hypothetical protein
VGSRRLGLDGYFDGDGDGECAGDVVAEGDGEVTPLARALLDVVTLGAATGVAATLVK